MEKIFYLAQVLGGLNVLLGILVLSLSILVVFAGIVVIVREDDGYENPEHMKKALRTALYILVIGILGLIFIPSKKTFLFMVGSKAVDSIIEENPEVTELPGNTLNLLNEYIKAETEKVKAKNEKE